jgi:hypothetical protein
MERVMSDLDRLHEIINALPPQQVHALLTHLAPPQPIGDEEFARRLAEAPEEEVDEGTASWPPKPNQERASPTAN